MSQDNERRLEQANRLLSHVQLGKVELMAPELAKYEIGNAILKKGLTDAQTLHNLETFYSLPIQFISDIEKLA